MKTTNNFQQRYSCLRNSRRSSGCFIPIPVAVLLLTWTLLWISNPSPVRGALLAYEGFDYGPAGSDLLGQSGGTGFSGAWLSSEGLALSFDTASGSLPFPRLPTLGHHARSPSLQTVTGLRRALTSPMGISGTTRYISILLRPEGVLHQGVFSGFFGFYLDGSLGPDLFVGKPGGGALNNYVIEDVGGTGQFASSVPVVSDQTALLVVKAEFLAGADRFTLYVNPAPGGAEPSTGAVKNDTDLGTVSGIVIFSSGEFAWDEVRIAETFADVTPSSEGPPQILLSPQDQVVTTGSTATFEVNALGTAPLSYQWFHNTTTAIPDATDSTLVLTDVQLPQAGEYTVIVSNSLGSVTSQVARLTVQVDLLNVTNSPWRYWDQGDQGTEWKTENFDDGAWPAGVGLFGFETFPAGYPYPFQTFVPPPAGTNGPNTVYYRTYFSWDHSPVDAVLTASTFVDDGAVFYLNGVEVGRLRLPNDPVLFGSFAQVGIEGAEETLVFSPESLIFGTNVLAVEVHQASLTSSDHAFGISLHGVPQESFDFGDAPDPVMGSQGHYPTLRINDGARHRVLTAEANLFLGSDPPDADPDGQENALALGDDLNGVDDEDGVLIPPNLMAGQDATITVTANDTGRLNAWIDYNRDGDWDEVGEQVFTNEVLSVGANELSLEIPSDMTDGISFARFRFGSQSDLLPVGEAIDGEVEDYFVRFGPNNPPVASDDSFIILEDMSLSGNVINGDTGQGTDTDPDGDPLLALVDTPPFQASSFELNSDGSFSYIAAQNFNGLDVFSYRTTDGSLESSPASVTINITAVNDAPSFSIGPNLYLSQNPGAKSFATWAADIRPGPPDEAGQSLEFHIDNDNPALFTEQPQLSLAGDLTFSTTGDLGSATVTVSLSDNGGTLNGGQDTSASQKFRISVTPPKLIASDGAAEDQLGYSVSVGGEAAVIGAPFANVGGNGNQGAAYVFERNSAGDWIEVKKLIASDGSIGDQLGWAVSISGDIVVVGANRDDDSRGAAYVFDRNAGGSNQWGEVTKLLPSDGLNGDQFGAALSVDGDVIVVAALLHDVGGNTDQGAGYVFERHAGGPDQWGQVKKLLATDGGFNDQLGHSVSIHGDDVVIGAATDNNNQGSAYVFARDQGGTDNWGQVTKLLASDGLPGDIFGAGVAMNGDLIVVGAGWDDVDSNVDQGSVYLFERNEGGPNNWGQVKKVVAIDGEANDAFGSLVSIDGDVLAVGAPFDTVGANFSQGSAYLFERHAGGADQWGITQRLISFDGEIDDQFGSSISVHGDIVVVGATQDTIDDRFWQGSAYVFEGSPSTPPQILVQPQGQSKIVGSTVTLRVGIASTEAIDYQWYKDDIALDDRGRVRGAASSELVLSNLDSSDAGIYHVVVSNSFGTATSQDALLRVVVLGPVTTVLVFNDFSGTIYEDALSNLGLTYQRYSTDSSFNTAVRGADVGTTLVVVDAVSASGRNLSGVEEFVRSGGRAILQYLDMQEGSLTDAFGLATVQTFTIPDPVYDWSDSQLFEGVTIPLMFADVFTRSGQRLEPVPEAQAVAGFTVSPAFGQAALVIGNSGRTIVNGFAMEESTSSLSATRLAQNEIVSLLSVNAPEPFILSQPVDLSVIEGAAASFHVVAGGKQPLHYQWYLNGGTPLSGATNSVLTILNSQKSDAGTYHVVVTNDHGVAISQNAVLTIDSVQPISTALLFNDYSRTVYETALGNVGLPFQRYNNDSSFNAAVRAANVSTTLVVVDAVSAAGRNFSAVEEFIRAGGRVVFQYLDMQAGSLSEALGLMSVQPFTVSASVYDWGNSPLFDGVPSPLIFEDFFIRSGQRYQPAPGAQALAGFTLNPTTGQAALVVGNSERTIVNGFAMEEASSFSSAVRLVQNEIDFLSPRPPVIVAQPEDLAVALGDEATFSVLVSGSLPLNYEWTMDGVEIPAAAQSDYSINNVQSNHLGGYSVVVSNPFGAVTSRVARLEIAIRPEIIQPPLSQSVVEGGNVTFSVGIDGNPAPYTFQWRHNFTFLTNIVTDQRIAFYTLTDVQMDQGGLYRVFIANPAAPVLSFVSPGTNWTLTVLADTDGDRLPDEWEMAHNLNPNVPNGNADTDGDGQTDEDEYIAGTDPQDADSYLKIDRIEATGSATLEFMAVSNRTYTLQYTDQASGGVWENLADIIASATNRVEMVHDPASTNQRYYRLVTPRQE